LIFLSFSLHLLCDRVLSMKLKILHQVRIISRPEENAVASVIIDSKQLIRDYLDALSAKPKTEDLVNQYVSDPGLKEHIRQAEAAFPGYELVAHQIVAEGDIVALRGTFYGVHKGEFAGIPPTGKKVSGDLMLFYRISEGLIVEHWMQWDMKAVVDQLTN
jgi:predicted ester cyclase